MENVNNIENTTATTATTQLGSVEANSIVLENVVVALSKTTPSQPSTSSTLNETTNTTSVGVFPEFIKPLITKLYTTSLVSQIADVHQLASPEGLVYTLFSTYGGNNDETANEIRSTNSVVISIGVDANGGTIEDSALIGETVIGANGQGEIVYAEGKNLLVKTISGFFGVGDSVSIAASGVNDFVSESISNRNYAKRKFQKYSGPYTTSYGEMLKTISNVNHEIKGVKIQTKSRKLRSRISREALEDIKNVFGKEFADELLLNEFTSEMIQAVDAEVLSYIRDIATPINDVVLSNSYGTQSGLVSVVGDLYANIHKLTTDLMRDTRRKKNFFVVASAGVVGLLMSSPLHVKPEVEVDGEGKKDKLNHYYMGKVGGIYNLYLDPFATDDYVLVGFGKSDSIGNSGLIFAPYIDMIWEGIDPETGHSVFFHNVRYGYSSHPQDTGEGNSDSIFFKTFNVNIQGLTNYENIK